MLRLHIVAEEGQVPGQAAPLPADVVEALACYDAGSDEKLRGLSVAPAPTRFASRVREAILAIPRGEVRTYGQIATRIGQGKAARAVGRACATNPVPLIVPCHRVIASDRGLHGFGLGLSLKRRLLQFEGVQLESECDLVMGPIGT